MDFLDVIKSRRSIRNYKAGESLTKEQINMLLEAAMHAPSACNTRPWQFYVVTNRDTLNEIANTHPYAKMLKTASLAIIVCALPDVQNDIAQGYFPQDCAAATENILLQAASMGLGSCWCGVYPKENRIAEIRDILSVPENVLPFNVIVVGVPNEMPDARGGYDSSKAVFIV